MPLSLQNRSHSLRIIGLLISYLYPVGFAVMNRYLVSA
jgi:hypothetical protein